MDRRNFTRHLAGAIGAVSLGGRFPFIGGSHTSENPSLRVNGDRVNRHLAELSEFGKNPYGGVSRVAYSDFDKQGREYAMRLMREAKLEVRVDTVGNIFGRRAGSDSSRKPLLFGSHIDSVPDGGNFDGDLGSLSAIEVAQTLAENNIVTKHPLEIVIFQNEEGGTIGSRGMAGHLADKDLDLVAKSGKTLRDGIAFIGGDPTKISASTRQKGDFAAYVELHIEQGGNLDAEHLDVGVVEGIVSIGWWDVTIEGFANHAGTTPMDKRHDALLAAAKYIEAVNNAVRGEPGRQVGTVGEIEVQPGARNVIPGKVRCSLEIRDLDQAKQLRLYEKIKREAEQIGQASGTTFTFKETYLSTPALMDDRVKATIDSSAKSMGLTTKSLPSGAGHDAQYMAQLCPAGMIFVPSVGGISHSPKEYTKPQDCINGANVLLQTMLNLDAGSWT